MIRGELDHLHLGDLLQWLQMGNLTGRLTFNGTGRERRIDFLDGRVVFVSSQVPGERLASWLAGEGHAHPAELRSCLAVSLLRRTLFTDVLLERSVVEPEILRAAIKELAETIATRLMLSPKLSFTFDDQFPVKDLLGLELGIDPHQLLFEAARRSDEGGVPADLEEDLVLPFAGSAFDTFFWTVLREGLTPQSPLDGEELNDLRGRLQEIASTLGQWLDTTPGLVPLPECQSVEVEEAIQADGEIPLHGRPHVVWNKMVVACSVRCPGVSHPDNLAALEREAEVAELWQAMVSNGAWRRNGSPRLDRLTPAIAERWSRLAAVAAPHLGVDPQAATLAAHLLVVPVDLVLWVLSSVPMPHGNIQRAVLRRLSRRIGSALAARSDFPEEIGGLFSARQATPLAVSLHLGRGGLSAGMSWLDPVQEAEEELLGDFDASTLAGAATAVDEAGGSPANGQVGVG